MSNGNGNIKLSDTYGVLTFAGETLRRHLPEEVYDKLEKTMRRGLPPDPSIADTVAAAMRSWALEHGATHYTHWFQPLTGSTAEKHDAFLTLRRGPA
jgi:glutamine synthetase